MDKWIIDRDPTPEEVEQAGDVGFILCISGKLGACTYDHAIDMQDNFFEDGRWYLHGGMPNKTSGLQGDEYEMYKVHGWMLPPVWLEPQESEKWVNFAEDLIPIMDEAESEDKKCI